MSKGARSRRLTARDLGLTMVAFGIAGVAEVGLRTTTLPRLARFLGVPLSTTDVPVAGADERKILPSWAFRRLSASRRAVRHWPFGDTCLREALVGGAMIRTVDPVLRVGVAKVDGEIKAHAWLEIEGRSLDPGAADFGTVQQVGK